MEGISFFSIDFSFLVIPVIVLLSINVLMGGFDLLFVKNKEDKEH